MENCFYIPTLSHRDKGLAGNTSLRTFTPLLSSSCHKRQPVEGAEEEIERRIFAPLPPEEEE